MAIARKPKSNTNAVSAPVDDPRAVAFIAKAATPPESPPPPPESGKVPVMIRFDVTLLRRIDEAAKRRCISRTAWINSTLSHTLDRDDG